ncbi:hypothetical protein HOG48_05940 [Candidatus Peregrinibacteria bacterium]|nr:hypothetical protein [Candidatus Peregrinibacteria bacterium]
MQDNLPYLFDRKGMSRTYDRDLKIAEKLLLKKNDTMGGIGLNFIKTPEEILALYATFAFFGYEAQGIEAFVSIYWGFDGIYDPRITPGHLFLLSSFIKRPWNSSEEVWQHSVGRAKLAADRVYAKDGVITGWDGTEYTIEEVYAQIEGARPKTYAEAKAEGRHSFSPRHGYDGGALTAAREMRERFGDDAREEVQGVETSLEGRIQGKMVKKGEGALRKLSDRGPLVYGDVFNERGEAVSIYAGFINENGNLEVLSKDVFSFERMYGSVGKLILVAALAKKGITVDSDDPLVQEFLYNLMHSRREIIQNAKDLGVSEEDVASLIECFGTPHSGMTDPITAAAMGTFDTSHYDLAAMMMAARTGEPMPRPHVVTGYFLRDGRYVTVEPEYSEDAHTCASLIHTPSSVDGGESETWRWFQVPLSDGGTSDSRGTLWSLNGLTDRASIAGKTGTVGKKRSRGGVGETNMTTVVFGTGPVVNSSGEVEVPALYGVQSIGYLDLFDSEGNMRDIGGQFSAGNLVSPVVRDVLQTTRHPQASDDLRSDMGL